MSLTVANLEEALVNRAGDLLVFMGLSAATDGANPDLREPIAFGCRQAGLTLASPLETTDADLVRLDVAYLDKLLDLAELRLLMSLANRFTEADTYVGTMARVDYSSVGRSIQNRLDRQMKLCEKLYGYSRSVLTAGYITLPLGTQLNTNGGTAYPYGSGAS